MCGRFVFLVRHSAFTVYGGIILYCDIFVNVFISRSFSPLHACTLLFVYFFLLCKYIFGFTQTKVASRISFLFSDSSCVVFFYSIKDFLLECSELYNIIRVRIRI